MQKEIKQTWHFNQSPKEVWEYLTKPELIEQWLMKNDFQPVVGHKFRFTFTPKEGSPYDGAVNCEVLEVKPFSRLSYSWNGKRMDGGTYDSTVIWTLNPIDKGTELTIQHNGFILLEDFMNTSSGWNTCVKRMEDLLNAVTK